jgi:multiple sugar transport system substrate-binding protein
MKKRHRLVLAVLTAIGLASASVPAKAQEGPFNWRRYAGSTITFLSENHPWPSAVLPYLDEFKKLTGIDVRVETFVEAQAHQRLNTLLQQKSSDIDVYMALKARDGQLYYTSGWYYDLTPYLKDPTMTAPGYDLADFYQNLLELPAYDNKVVVIPLNLEGPILEWRQDVFDACHLQPPATLEDIGVVAAKLKACRPDLVAFVSRGLRSGLTYTFVPFFYNLGGDYDKIMQRQAYCTPAGEKALSYYTDLLNKYGPPGVSNYTFYQITDILGQGRAAMAFASSNEFGKITAYPGRSDDLAVKALPPGAESHVSRPLVIDWGLAISAFSKNPGPSWYFLQWATSKEMDARIALKGIAPPRQSVAQSAEFAKWVAEKPNRQQWVQALKDISATGHTSSEPPSMINVPEANDVIGAGVQSVMLGQVSAKDAGCKIDDGIMALMPRK